MGPEGACYLSGAGNIGHLGIWGLALGTPLEHMYIGCCSYLPSAGVPEKGRAPSAAMSLLKALGAGDEANTQSTLGMSAHNHDECSHSHDEQMLNLNSTSLA